MTADEMFRKQGYRPDKSLTAPGMQAYWNKGTRAKIWINKDSVQYVPGDDRGFRMSTKVLLACAERIKEMEAETVCDEDGCRIVYPETTFDKMFDEAVEEEDKC